MGDGLLDEVVGVVDVRQRLLQVDDVDAIALGHDEALHLGVPATGLVPEVDAALGLAHGDDGHAVFSLVSLSVVPVCRVGGLEARLRHTRLAPATHPPASGRTVVRPRSRSDLVTRRKTRELGLVLPQTQVTAAHRTASAVQVRNRTLGPALGRPATPRVPRPTGPCGLLDPVDLAGLAEVRAGRGARRGRRTA